MRLPEGVVLLALCAAAAAMACSSPASTESASVSATPAASTPAATPPTPAAPAAPAAPTTPAAAAPSSPGAAAPSSAPAADESNEVCPLPRRCDPACAKANSKAGDACKPTAQDFMKQLPNADELGRCIAACLKVKEAKVCVGAATEAECACNRKCKDLIPAALREKGEAYNTCYRKAIEAACY